MFCLNDSLHYWLWSEPTDMRKSFHTLTGIVNNKMCKDPLSGDVFIFINKRSNRIKLLHWEPGGMVLYSKLLEAGTLGQPPSKASDGSIEWSDLVLMVEGIIEKPGSRRRRLESLKNMHYY